MNRTHGTLAASVLAVLVGALATARAIAESEHDPWPPDCPLCGLFAPTHFGPLVRDWMNNHNCKGEA